MSKRIAAILIVSLLFGMTLFAQGSPRSVMQELFDIGGSYPDNLIYPEEGTIIFNVWIDSRPQYVMDYPNEDLGTEAYLTGSGRFIIYFNLANFMAVGSPVDWQAGEIVKLQILQPSTNRIAIAEFTITPGTAPLIRYNDLAVSLYNAPPVYPPRNLTAQYEEGAVQLNWEVPNIPTRDDDATRIELLGYNVYRDNEKVNTRLVTETSYADSDVQLDNLYFYYVKALYMEGESERSNVQIVDLVHVPEDTVVPSITTALKGNYPNPFNPETTISFDLAEAGNVSIDVFNSRGQRVKTLVNENKAAGRHSVVWNGRDESNREVSSGIYFYRMQKGSYISSKKMIMMK